VKATNEELIKARGEAEDAQARADEADRWPRSATSPLPMVDDQPTREGDDIHADAKTLEGWSRTQARADEGWARVRELERELGIWTTKATA